MRSIFLLLLLPLLFATGCAVNPVTGKNEISFISESSEIAMGAEQYMPSQQSQGGRFTTDESLNAYVQEVGQRVATAGDRDLPYEFVVLNSSVPNAWALPGGKIAINRGLLTELNNEAELAAVLGHEAVHAAAKHGANAVQRGMIMQGLVTATAIGASISESDYSNYVVGGAQLGAQIIGQKYGRDAELESDYYGTQYMARAGYDPAASISLQETFVRLSEGHETSFIDGLFASHPPSQSRVAANRETVQELGNPGGELGKARYQKAISFLKENQYAYTTFDHATKLAAEGKYSTALANVTDALKKVPNEPRFHGLVGNIHYQQKQYDQAEAAFARALDLDNNYFEYHLGQGRVLVKKGQHTAARQYLIRSNELLPTAIASHELGELSLSDGNRNDAKQYFSQAMGVGGQVGQAASRAFVTLDLADNPGRYFKVEPAVSDQGYLIVNVTNLINQAVSQVQTLVNVNVNGATQARTLNIDLGPSETRAFQAGWQFNATDQVSAVNITITGATLN